MIKGASLSRMRSHKNGWNDKFSELKILQNSTNLCTTLQIKCHRSEVYKNAVCVSVDMSTLPWAQYVQESSTITAIASYRKEISHRIWIHATVGSLHFNVHPRNDSLIPSSITRNLISMPPWNWSPPSTRCRGPSWRNMRIAHVVMRLEKTTTTCRG